MTTTSHTRKNLMHLFTPELQASPFDVNMAMDAGFDSVTPYTQVTVAQVLALTQDAIFSRGPKGGRRTAIRIGGRDLDTALDMFEAARKAMVPPFAVSVFVDPSGAFTTAAAMVAMVEKHLRRARAAGLDGARVLVYGGTGPVGVAAGVIAALEGAQVTLLSHSGLERAQAAQAMVRRRYQVELGVGLTDSVATREALASGTEVVLACARAGVQVVSTEMLASAGALRVAADVNAVPPLGIQGVDLMDDGREPVGLSGGRVAGIGALAVGNVKYQTESRLCQSMVDAAEPQHIDFVTAFREARALAGV